MLPKVVAVNLLVAWLAVGAFAGAQDEKKRSGTIIGVVKGQKASKDGKNTFIDVLAPGEEKARSYHVMYDPKIKGPIPSVLKEVRHSKVGDTVEFEWVETGHGPAIQKFKVLRPAGDKKDAAKDKQ